MYEYAATVVRVVDADTIDCDVDLGFYVTLRLRFRLAAIDAWEVRGEEREAGLVAKQALIDLLREHDNQITVKSEKTGKYGRWLGYIHIGDMYVNEWLVEKGHADWSPG